MCLGIMTVPIINKVILGGLLLVQDLLWQVGLLHLSV